MMDSFTARCDIRYATGCLSTWIIGGQPLSLSVCAHAHNRYRARGSKNFDDQKSTTDFGAPVGLRFLER